MSSGKAADDDQAALAAAAEKRKRNEPELDSQKENMVDKEAEGEKQKSENSDGGEKEDATKAETDEAPQKSVPLLNGVGGSAAAQKKLNGTEATTTRSALQRESSLKRKLILAFSSTKSVLRPACIFGPRESRKKSI